MIVHPDLLNFILFLSSTVLVGNNDTTVGGVRSAEENVPSRMGLAQYVLKMSASDWDLSDEQNGDRFIPVGISTIGGIALKTISLGCDGIKDEKAVCRADIAVKDVTGLGRGTSRSEELTTYTWPLKDRLQTINKFCSFIISAVVVNYGLVVADRVFNININANLPATFSCLGLACFFAAYLFSGVKFITK